MYLYLQTRSSLGEGIEVTLPDQPHSVLNKFAVGSSMLTSKHRQQISKIADYVVAQEKASTPFRWVYAVGHTDVVGTTERNCELGMVRARAVVRALMNQIFIKNGGRIPAQLGAVRETLGSTAPVEGERALSRRVEVYLLRSETPPRSRAICPQPAWCMCDR